MNMTVKSTLPFALWSIALLADCGQPATADSAEFEPATTVEESRHGIESIPTTDIWWTEYGEIQGWRFRNLHKIFPTVNVYRHGSVRPLETRPLQAISEFEVETPGGKLSFDKFLYSEYTTAMGIVILHKGDIVFESYPRMQPYEKPVYWSVAKVLVSTVVRILEERGEIDVSQPIDKYISALRNSSFAGISVRNLLDMATGLDCADDYTSRETCYYLYSMSIGDGYRDENAPDNPYDFVASFKARKINEPGEVFSYSGVNTFILSWLVEEVTGMPFQDALTREVWFRIGAESDASFIAPRYGIPVTHGGFLATMRDVARFGLLFTPSYRKVSSQQIISDDYLKLIQDGGNPSLRSNAGYPSAVQSGISHNVYQWDEIYVDGTFYKGGWAGQGLAVNPRQDVVAVFTSYIKDDQESEMKLEPVVLDLLRSVFVTSNDR
jgi:CubicO group peptidase (beta-lactamase class C family)